MTQKKKDDLTKNLQNTEIIKDKLSKFEKFKGKTFKDYQTSFDSIENEELFLIRKEWVEQFNDYLKKGEIIPDKINRDKMFTSKIIFFIREITVYHLLSEIKYEIVNKKCWDELKDTFGFIQEINVKNRKEIESTKQNFKLFKVYNIQNIFPPIKTFYLVIKQEYELKIFKKVIIEIIKKIDGEVIKDFKLFAFSKNICKEKRKEIMFEIALCLQYGIFFYFIEEGIIIEITDNFNENKKISNYFLIIPEGTENLKIVFSQKYEPQCVLCIDNIFCNIEGKKDIKEIEHYEFHVRINPYQTSEYNFLVLLKNYNKQFIIGSKINGLLNKGNFCYMNSGLQGIIRCNYFIYYILSLQFCKEIKTTHEESEKLRNELFCCFYNFLQEYKNPNSTIIKPDIIREAFIKCETKFADKNQHDSFEFIVDFINAFSIYRKNSLPYLLEGETNNFKREIANEDSMIKWLFYSLTKEIKVDKCKFEKFLVIPLQIPLTLNYILQSSRIESQEKKNILSFNQEKITYIDQNFHYLLISKNLREIKVLNQDELHNIGNLFVANQCKDAIITIKKDKINQDELTIFLSEVKAKDISSTSLINLYTSEEVKDGELVTLPKKYVISKKSSLIELIKKINIQLEDKIIENIRFLEIYKLEDLYQRNIKNGFLFLFSEKNDKNSLNISPNKIELMKVDTKDNLNLLDCFDLSFGKKKRNYQMYFERFPLYLILLLKKFRQIGNKFQKIEVAVNAEKEIDLIPYSKYPNSSSPNNDFKYTLISKICHRGETDNGHYYAYIPGDNNKWMAVNDKKVEPQRADNRKDELVLFYEKVNLAKIFGD